MNLCSDVFRPSKPLGAEFLFRLKYRNTLPDIRIEPKLLKHENESVLQEMVPYVLTDSERDYTYQFYDENLLKSIPIDLLHFDKYQKGSSGILGFSRFQVSNSFVCRVERRRHGAVILCSRACQ